MGMFIGFPVLLLRPLMFPGTDCPRFVPTERPSTPVTEAPRILNSVLQSFHGFKIICENCSNQFRPCTFMEAPVSTSRPRATSGSLPTKPRKPTTFTLSWFKTHSLSFLTHTSLQCRRTWLPMSQRSLQKMFHPVVNTTLRQQATAQATGGTILKLNPT